MLRCYFTINIQKFAIIKAAQITFIYTYVKTVWDLTRRIFRYRIHISFELFSIEAYEILFDFKWSHFHMKRKSCYNQQSVSAQHSVNRKIWNSKSDYSLRSVCVCVRICVLFLLSVGVPLEASLIWHFGHVKTISHYLFFLYIRTDVYIFRTQYVRECKRGKSIWQRMLAGWLVGWFSQNLRAQIVNMLCAAVFQCSGRKLHSTGVHTATLSFRVCVRV